jgi:hypothetical protein
MPLDRKVERFIAKLRQQMAEAQEHVRCDATPEEQGGYDQAIADITAWLDAGAPEPPWEP